MKLIVKVSDETKEILEDLADHDGIEPSKRIHKWVRTWIFDSAMNQPSMASVLSNMIQRGEARLNNQMVTAAELHSGAGKFAFPNGKGDDYKPGPNEIEIVFGRRVGDLLPDGLSYMDLAMGPDARRLRDWNDLPSWVGARVSAMAAEEQSKNEAKEAEEEEQELYPASKKDKKPKKD